MWVFSHSVMSDYLQFHGLEQARPPCPSPSPGASSNSCPLGQWCHPHLIICRPLLLLPSILPSIRVLSNELALCIRWPGYWSFSISPSNEYSGLISFRIDWLGLLAVLGLKVENGGHLGAKSSLNWQLARKQEPKSYNCKNWALRVFFFLSLQQIFPFRICWW